MLSSTYGNGYGGGAFGQAYTGLLIAPVRFRVGGCYEARFIAFNFKLLKLFFVCGYG